MTKDFYTSFLNYISQKELKRLYSNLSKSRQKLSVNGFPPNKTPPIASLAHEITRREKAFFDVLEESYSPVFDSCDDAIKVFSPDMAVTCLVYLIKNGMTDETLLSSLLEKGTAVQEKVQLPQETGKSKKKAEEFREKYLSTRRELLQLKNNYTNLQTENASLKTELSRKSSELDSVRETFRHFEEKSLSAIDQLKGRVQELEESISEYQTAHTVQAASILLIVDMDESDGLGVDTLTYDNISKLFEIIDKYDEILLVINDIPFTIKRKIHKVATLQEKLVTFSTKQEMLEYAKQRRNS